MEHPPFKLARTLDTRDATDASGSYGLATDRYCAPRASENEAPMAKRRTRLAELDSRVHCSVIGTCLSTAELRRLITRFTQLDRNQATDLQIHHAAVELSIEGGPVAKALHKALDTRYAVTLKRFRDAADEATLRALWRAALESGEVPGAYWAVMTHAHVTPALRDLAFGDVHMLSHLVGAANRADIRRLVALEEESAVLKEKLARQQARLQEMSAQRDAAVSSLSEQVAQLSARLAARVSQPDAPGELASLRQALQERDQRLALHTARRAQAEQRLLLQQESLAEMQVALEQMQASATAAQAETRATEEALARSLESDPAQQDHDGAGALQMLQGKHIVYVGGRPGSHTVLARLVQSAGGELTIHDGGIEDRKGLLAAVLARAHMVVFPVDCISHDAMNTLKRVCARHDIDYHPLRTASAASFIELLSRLAGTASVSSAPVSRFCLRHG